LSVSALSNGIVSVHVPAVAPLAAGIVPPVIVISVPPAGAVITPPQVVDGAGVVPIVNPAPIVLRLSANEAMVAGEAKVSLSVIVSVEWSPATRPPNPDCPIGKQQVGVKALLAVTWAG
jgi:hypothetical protein